MILLLLRKIFKQKQGGTWTQDGCFQFIVDGPKLDHAKKTSSNL